MKNQSLLKVEELEEWKPPVLRGLAVMTDVPGIRAPKQRDSVPPRQSRESCQHGRQRRPEALLLKDCEAAVTRNQLLEGPRALPAIRSLRMWRLANRQPGESRPVS